MPPSEQQPPIPPEPPPPIRWRSWPVRDDTGRGLLLVIGLLITAAAVGWLSAQVYLGLAALAALLMALWRFFLPVVFELSGEGVDQRLFGRQRRIPWQAIRRWEVRSAGVLMLPHEDRSAMAPFRGLYLPWTTHRDEVLAHVRHYLQRPEETQEFVAEHDAV
ncbi:MAG: hypothetical protein ACYSWU_14345 [Planctomycetota bacterium]|jgi:hypothetical protein